jgi:hypothetical protein
MKRLIILFLLVLGGGLPAFGQGQFVSGAITAADTSGTCGTAGGFVSITTGSSASVAFSVSGTFSATLQFVTTVDGTNYVAVNAFPPNSTTGVTSTTSGGTWTVNVPAMATFCVRSSAFTSGSATVNMRNSIYVDVATLSGGGGGGGGTVTSVTGNAPITSSGGNTPAIGCATCTTNASALTSNVIPKGGGGQALALSSITDNGTTIAATEPISTTGSLTAGSGCTPAGATATGGICFTEAAATGWTPTAGFDYIRADSTAHSLECSFNGAAEILCESFAALSGGTNTTAAFIIGTGASLAFTGSATLDMSADTSATAFKVPVGAGFTASANGVINYDSTAGNTHQRTAGADSLSVGEASAIASGFIPKSTSATNSLIAATLCDEGITTANILTCTDTNGIAGISFQSTDTTAGFVDYPQGTTSVAKRLCAIATSICEQAPTAVTSYLVNKPGVAASGVLTNNVAAAVDTQGFSGDAGHTISVTFAASQTVGATSLCSTAICPAGDYMITAFVEITTACTTTGTIIPWVGWTDDAGAKGAVGTTFFGNGFGAGFVAATGTLTDTATTNWMSGSYFIHSTGAAAINYGYTTIACGSGSLVGKYILHVVPVG